MKNLFLPLLLSLVCLNSAVGQSSSLVPIPQRPTLPLPIPTRPSQAGFLYLSVSSAYGAPAGTSSAPTLSVPSALPPAMQGNIVAAVVSVEAASSTANGGWALSSDGRVGSVVTSSGGAGPSSGQVRIISLIEDAAAVAGSSLSTGVVAIKANGAVAAAMDSSLMEVPPEASDLRTINHVSGLFFGLGADGRFIAWTYSDTWPPRPFAPASIATNWTANKPFMVQAEMTSGMYGQRLVGLTDAGEILAWDEQGNEVTVPQDGNNDISFFRISSNSMLQILAAVRSNGGVFLARLGQPELLPLPQGLSAVAEIRVLSGYSEVVVALQTDGGVKAWKADSGEELLLPAQASSGIGISANGDLTRPDGSVLQLSYVQADTMDPSSGSITASPIQSGVVASGPNYVISRDPGLILGFPLSVLARLVAEEILTHTNNYGLATKPDLLGAVQDALASGEQQGIATVQSAPNNYSLYSADQYAASYSNGISAGTSLVTANPASYNLYTTDSIMDLRMGGLMIQKQGGNAVVSFQPQTTTALGAQSFTNNGTPITNTIPMPGNKGFLRIQAR